MKTDFTIEEALLLMTKRQRRVVRLWLRGLNQRQIAKRMGISQQAVSAHLNRALNRKNITTIKKLL